MPRIIIKDIPTYALQFDGINDRLSFGNIFNTVHTFTSTFWLNTTTLPSGNFEVPWGYGNSRWFFIYPGASSAMRFTVKTSGVERIMGTSGSLGLGVWVFCAGYYNAATGLGGLRVYNANGGLVYANEATITPANPDSTATALTMAFDPNRGFHVDMIGDDPRFYGAVLTHEEIDGLAEHTEPDNVNLLLHAELDVQNGTQAFCRVGDRSGYVGTLVNGPTYVSGIVPKHRLPAAI